MRFPVEVVRRVREARRRRTSSIDVPDVAARPGPRRPDLGRGRRRWPTRSRRPARRWSTPASAGTRRGCRRSSPRCRAAAWAATTARLRPEARHPGVRVQPDQHPRGGRGDPGLRRRRPGLDGPAVPGRPRVRRQGRRRPRRRDQHLHRLQPGLPGPHLRQPARVLPGQPARLPRDRRWCSPRPGRAARVAVVGAGPGRPRRRGRPPPSAATTSRCSRRAPEIGGQFRLAMADPRQGGVRRDAALLHPPARRARGRRPALDAGPTAADLAPYDEVVVATGVTPAGRDVRRRRPPAGGVLRRRDLRRRAGRAAGSRWSAPAASASTSAISSPTTATDDARGRGWRTGASATPRCTPAA